MFPIALVLVITSGLLNAVWNLFAKRSLNKGVFLWSLQWVAVIVFLPWAVGAIKHRQIPLQGWMFLILSALLHGIYVMLLVRTYESGEFSQVYPLMRSVSPILVPMLGILILGERLSIVGWFAIAAISVGIWMLGDWRFCRGTNDGRPSKSSGRALLVGLAITSYTTFDKVTLHYIPAVTLNDAGNFANLVALSWGAVRSRAIKSEWIRNGKSIVLGGILSPGAYLLFLLALHRAPVAQLAPMREVGTVFGTILGIIVLRETQGRRRIIAAGWIALGVFLLGTWG